MVHEPEDRARTTSGAASPPGTPDASHLDEDPECLEDPVHCGDAQHQHNLHAHPGSNVEPTPSA